jgi:type VI secretion system protein ImpA
VFFEDATRQAILAQIDGGVGVDGREDEGVAGDLLREVRSQRKALIRNEQAVSMGQAASDDGGWDWERLAEEAQRYLSEYGKDLEPMAVLVEAATRLGGPEGLAEAMALLAEMVEAFWDQGLFPAEDEDGVETRFQPLSGLSGGGGDKDGALLLPVRRMPLVEAGGDALRYLDKIKADTLATAQTGDADQRAARKEEAAAMLAEIDAIVRKLSRSRIEAVIAQVEAAETGWRRAVAFISERTKPRFPAASRLSSELEAMRGWLSELAGRLPQEITAIQTEGVANGEAIGGVQAAEVAASGFTYGNISRREDALRAIGIVADYFSTYEPLSPIGETLREVDRRARLSLHELLQELIPDESARSNFYWRSGIRPPTGENG